MGLSISEPVVWDGFLFALLLRLMQVGTKVRIDGAISRQALRNAIELQDVWSLWCPDRYRRVALEPASVVDVCPDSGKPIICAFSGGVDGMFSLLRHGLGSLGEASLRVRSALMVHGFDVPLSQTRSFDLLVRRCGPLFSQIGIPLHVARTNLRSSSRQHWGHSFGAQLAGCLHQFGSVFSGGIIGSSEPYDDQFFPWGSNPITDRLLSGDDFDIFHDGAGFSRTSKLECLKDDETVLRTLKVCWAGPHPEENCGICEKCVRTRLNLLAVGVSNPPCFSGTFTLDMIGKICISHPLHYNELLSIFNYSCRHGIKAQWLDVLGARLARYRRNIRIRRFGAGLRRCVEETNSIRRVRRWLKRKFQGLHPST